MKALKKLVPILILLVILMTSCSITDERFESAPESDDISKPISSEDPISFDESELNESLEESSCTEISFDSSNNTNESSKEDVIIDENSLHYAPQVYMLIFYNDYFNSKIQVTKLSVTLNNELNIPYLNEATDAASHLIKIINNNTFRAQYESIVSKIRRMMVKYSDTISNITSTNSKNDMVAYFSDFHEYWMDASQPIINEIYKKVSSYYANKSNKALTAFKPYIMSVSQDSLGRTLFFDGTVKNRNLSATDVKSRAATVWLEEKSHNTSGVSYDANGNEIYHGYIYYLFTMHSGKRLYINYDTKSHSIVLSKTPKTEYIYDEFLETLCFFDDNYRVMFFGKAKSHTTHEIAACRGVISDNNAANFVKSE